VSVVILFLFFIHPISDDGRFCSTGDGICCEEGSGYFKVEYDGVEEVSNDSFINGNSAKASFGCGGGGGDGGGGGGGGSSPVCGNGNVEDTEECDDGNENNSKFLVPDMFFVLDPLFHM
jgi:hypothetical protein